MAKVINIKWETDGQEVDLPNEIDIPEKFIDEDGIDALLNSEEAIKNNKGVMYICEVNKRLERKLKHFRARKFDNELTCMKLIEV